MPAQTDATPAYRGYRLQALYTLWRILDADTTEPLVFQPEGLEDLAVYHADGQVYEVLQVKAHQSALTVSTLAPRPRDDTRRQANFFQRAVTVVRTYPHAVVRLISFGDVGQELRRAVAGEEPARNTVVTKLQDVSHISEADARFILEHLQLEPVDEVSLRQRVDALIRASCVGIDPTPAFDLLLRWLYDCAEHATKITRADIIARLNAVGRFLADRTAYHQEWFTVIEPIEDAVPDAQHHARLAEEFASGIAARYEHILANVDIPRPVHLARIDDIFTDSPIAIIHSASGQGKSTLAYRYLHDACPSVWRFRVKGIQDRRHALAIAQALIGHAQAIGIPLTVYLDVQPNDTDWTELVRELAQHPLMRVLVTIREEDWKRATVSRADFRYGDLHLVLTHEEAAAIYQGMTASATTMPYLSFADAWSRYHGEWPLMEFTYLLTHGQSLRERLQAQIARLRDEVRTGSRPAVELQLIRWVAVASSYEARLSTVPLCRALQLPDPVRTLDLLEQEYLLRLTENGALLSGFHPLRSMILADLLHDDTLTPWADSAAACLPLLHDEDIELFLLYAFSRHATDDGALHDAVQTWQPESWMGIAAVTRALLWRGIRTFVSMNRTLIDEAMATYGNSWVLLFAVDVTGALPNLADDMLGVLSSLLPEERIAEMRALCARVAETSLVMRDVKAWLAARADAPQPPTTVNDWQGLAETVFWLGQHQIPWPLDAWLASVDFPSALATLPFSTACELVVGLHTGYPSGIDAWVTAYRPLLIERLRRETRTVTIEDDGEHVTAHFLVDYQMLTETPSPSTAHHGDDDRLGNETTALLLLLRSLFPDRQTYACQGYGHRILFDELAVPFDATQKTGVARDRLPLRWLTTLNSTFLNLVEYPYRPDTWGEYANLVVDIREDIIPGLTQLTHATAQYLEGAKHAVLMGGMIDSQMWQSIKERLWHLPSLPKIAVDEWGFTGETVRQTVERLTPGRHAIQQKTIPVTELHRPFHTAWREYATSMGYFFLHADTVLALCSQLGQTSTTPIQWKLRLAQAEALGISTNLINITRYNLVSSLAALPIMQDEFQQLFGSYVAFPPSQALDEGEVATLSRLWPLWYFFTEQAFQVIPDAASASEEHVHGLWASVRSSIKAMLQDEARTGIAVQWVSETIAWDNTPTLWITVDSPDFISAFIYTDKAIRGIQATLSRGKDTRLLHEAIAIHWPQIAFVPLVHGKALGKSAWRVNGRALAKAESGKAFYGWKQFQQPIPDETFSQLGIEVWESPLLNTPTQFLHAATQMTILAGYGKDIALLPTMSDQESAPYQDNLDQYRSSIEQAYNKVFDALSQLVDELEQFDEEMLAHRQNIGIAFCGLKKIAPALTPPIEESGQISLAAIEAWVEMLREQQINVLITYSAWATDIIEAKLMQGRT